MRGGGGRRREPACVKTEVSDTRCVCPTTLVARKAEGTNCGGVGGGVCAPPDTPTSFTSNRMSEQLLCRWTKSPGATTTPLCTGKRACSQEMSHSGEVEMEISSSRCRSNQVAMASTCPDDVTASVKLLSGRGI